MELNDQYNLVKSSRQVLLDYCGTISEKDFVTENSTFGRGSIRNLLVHIGNTYEFWIGQQALSLGINFTEYATVADPVQAKALFVSIDRLVSRFIDAYSNTLLEELILEINNQKRSVSPLKLFTHVITHEFHHKGQILSLSRHVGYIPIDTDIIR